MFQRRGAAKSDAPVTFGEDDFAWIGGGFGGLNTVNWGLKRIDDVQKESSILSSTNDTWR